MEEQKDRLSGIFDLQKSLNDDIRTKRNLSGFTHEEWIQKHMLAMLSEMAEVLDEVNFKWWKNPKPVDSDALKEELVDVLHFYVSMCLEAGMTPQELYDRYVSKNRENFDRQAGLSEKPGYSMEKLDEQA
jgi:dimeric dUTPase (all-alpha-NTP-PPase superfamily)